MARVQLQNTTSNSMALDIPMDYTNYVHVALGAGASTNLASFTRDDGVSTIGFRGLVYTPVPAPVVSIWHAVEIS